MLEEDLDKSIEYLEEKEKELYIFDTNSISVWNELAGVYLYRKSDYDNASKYIDKILKLNPNSIQALMKKGIMLVFQNKYKESIDVLNKISLNGTSNDIYYFWMGYAYEKDGNQKLCHEYYSEFLSLSKDENSWGYKHAEEILINQ
jgi:tetratricopeptide (TPR) repeat protein